MVLSSFYKGLYLNLKFMVILFIIFLIFIFSIQGFLLKSSNNINQEVQSIQTKIFNFEKNFSKISNEIYEIERNENLVLFEKKSKIKKNLIPILKQFEDMENIKQVTYHSSFMDINFNIINRKGEIYLTSNIHEKNNSKKTKENNIKYTKNKIIEYKHRLYHEGEIIAHILFKKEMNSFFETLINTLPQVLLFTGFLLIVLYYIYNNIMKIRNTSDKILKKQLKSITNKKQSIEDDDFTRDKKIEKLHPSFYNIMIKLREYEELLHDLSHVITLKDLLPVMAHEVKNPVALIKGHAQLGIRSNSESRKDEIFKKINDNCDLVNRFLHESVQLVKSTDQKKERLKVETIMNDILVVVEAMIQISGIKFIKNFESKETVLEINRVKINHALINIIKNAIDATPRGGQISLYTYKDNDKYYITVSDTGCGISEDMKEKIFDKYFTTKKSKGTGIGLALAYNVVKNHKGRLWFESSEGKGTTFYIELPINRIN